MKEIIPYIIRYIEFCTNAFKYDMDVFSQGWIYYWMLVPAICYFIFFIMKWIIITLPFWLPFRIIFDSFNKLGKNK